MKILKRFNVKHFQAFLNTFIALGVFIMLLMFINFNAQAAKTAESTNRIVRSQNDILDAIKQLALDNKQTSEQKTNIIICMLQVPVAQRTTDTVTQCKKQVEDGVVSPASTSGSQSSSQTTNSNQPSSQTTPQQTEQSQGFVQTTVEGVRITVKQVQDTINSLLGR